MQAVKWFFFIAFLWVVITTFLGLLPIPMALLMAIPVMVSIGLIVSGSLEILMFIREKSAKRSDVMLSSGMIAVMVGVWILFGGGIYWVTTVLPYIIGVRLVCLIVVKVLERSGYHEEHYAKRREIVQAYDKLYMSVTTLIPRGEIRGAVHVIHGLWEGALNYRELGAFLATHGYVCVTHEQRTHGATWWFKNWRVMFKSKRSICTYDLLLQDVDTVRKMMHQRFPDVPLHLLGYSMGGNIAANYLIRYPSNTYQKAILSAPWLKLYDPRNRFRLGIRNLKLSYMLYRAARMPLRVVGMLESRPNMYMLNEVNKAGEQALKNAAKIQRETLVIAARHDVLVSNMAIQMFADTNPEHIRIKKYDNQDHSLHWGRGKHEVMADMLAFYLAEPDTTGQKNTYIDGSFYGYTTDY